MQVEQATSRNIVYVATNNPDRGQNAVLAYRRADDGTLSQAGCYLTGGTGFGNPDNVVGPEDSDQNLVLSADGGLLYAVNGGSDSIAVFRVTPDGSLAGVPGSPFPSGGIQPVSIGLADGHVYVVNKDHDPGRPDTPGVPNYAVFAVEPSGRLLPLPDGTVPAAKGVSPAQALVAAGGRLLFGAEPFGGFLRSFAIGDDGRLQPRASVEIEAPHPSPVGLAAHPREPVVYVGLPTRGQLAVYRYDADGTLTPAGSAPNSGRAICWIVTNSDGSRTYTVSNASNSVSVYDTSDPVAPVEMQSVRLSSRGGAFQEALDPSGRFLHVVTVNGSGQRADDNAVHVLPVATDGTLGTPVVTRLPVAPTTHPAGVACL